MDHNTQFEKHGDYGTEFGNGLRLEPSSTKFLLSDSLTCSLTAFKPQCPFLKTGENKHEQKRML